MIKKVSVSEVRLGMYIQELRGNWLQHPFWKKSFKLVDPADLDKLVHCEINEIWIDTAKGLDVADTTTPQTPTPAPPLLLSHLIQNRSPLRHRLKKQRHSTKN